VLAHVFAHSLNGAKVIGVELQFFVLFELIGVRLFAVLFDADAIDRKLLEEWIGLKLF
jgi:hypothetical protein